MEQSSALPVARVALRILIVVNWVFGALILGLLLLSFVSEAWVWRALGVGAMAGRGDVVAGMRSIMALGLAGIPVAHIVYSQLLRIVDSVRLGRPFSSDNADRLRRIAWAVLALELLRYALAGIAAALTSSGVPVQISGKVSVTAILAILLLFVLAQVFREGARMNEDLEGTV